MKSKRMKKKEMVKRLEKAYRLVVRVASNSRIKEFSKETKEALDAALDNLDVAVNHIEINHQDVVAADGPTKHKAGGPSKQKAKPEEKKQPTPKKKGKRRLSPEGRRSIQEAMKKRWADYHKKHKPARATAFHNKNVA